MQRSVSDKYFKVWHQFFIPYKSIEFRNPIYCNLLNNRENNLTKVPESLKFEEFFYMLTSKLFLRYIFWHSFGGFVVKILKKYWKKFSRRLVQKMQEELPKKNTQKSNDKNQKKWSIYFLNKTSKLFSKVFLTQFRISNFWFKYKNIIVTNADRFLTNLTKKLAKAWKEKFLN